MSSVCVCLCVCVYAHVHAARTHLAPSVYHAMCTQEWYAMGMHLHTVCDNITLLFRFVPFCFNKKVRPCAMVHPFHFILAQF